MKAATLVSCLGVFLVCVGCSQGGPEQEELARKVQALEGRVEALQKQAEDLALKSRIASGLLSQGGLADFFQSPEFWENTYDSGEADCARRCIAELQQLRAACAQKPEGQRLQCYEEASSRAFNCHRQCASL